MINLHLNRSFHPWQMVAAGSLLVMILSFASPQVSALGHGLWTALPALVVAGFAITQISPQAFSRTFARFRSAFLFGILFLIQAALRFAYEDDSETLWHTHFWGPILALGFLLFIGAYAELGRNAVARLRRWVLFGWCTSLALGLPTLIDHPDVARLTFGNPSAAENAAIWAPYGVAEYHVYTSLSICLGPLFIVALGLTGMVRWLALVLVCLGACAVLFSTFTMAAVLLVLSFFGTLLVGARAGRGWSRAWHTIMVLLTIALLPFLYTQASLFPQTQFVSTKAERLYKGFFTSGLEQGDETGRGWMFVDEMKANFHEPFLGYIPHVTGQRGHGHSSFANSLSLFGLFGAALWVAALGSVLKNSLRYAGDSTNRRILLLCWSTLVLGGILNPIWHSPVALLVVFALTLPARDNHSERNLFERISPRSHYAPAEAPPAGKRQSAP